MLMVNGREVEFVAGETVKSLLKRMNFLFPLVIVKVDGDVVPRSDYVVTPVVDGSDIAVIHMISGG